MSGAGRRRLIAALLAGGLLAGCATTASRGIPVRASGGVLVERTSGMSLYTFDRDVVASGRSACGPACVANWPPLAAAPDARPFREYTIIDRAEGGRQWAYKGRPLYRWSKDTGPADRSGDGVDNLWRVAKP